MPGTVHGDWWSLNGWWIFVGTAAVSLLSKYVIKWRGEHIFNPSNIGLVLCFLILGRTRAAPLDFWWGPMSAWLAIALAIIVAGGFLILSRLKLLRVAIGFWITFAIVIGILALAGHTMTARWHLGPISGFHLWWILITSPEVLVFLFFMITDPKTAPRSPTGRLVYAVSLGVLAGVMIAPTITEYAAKVALLGSLAVVCLALPLLRLVPMPLDRRLVLGIAAAAAAVAAAAMVVGNAPAVASASPPLPPGRLPAISILPGQGVQTKLDLHTAQLIAYDLLAAKPSAGAGPLRVWLVQGVEQGPPTATVQRGGSTYHLHQTGDGQWALPSSAPAAPVVAAPKSSALNGIRLRNVAPAVGLDFRQDSFRYGVSNDYTAMMGGGVCWLDYNGDGWQDLFAVNSYASADTAQWEAHGGLPRTQLFENVHGHFRNVTSRAHAGLQVQGDGCAAADLNGDGRPDLIVTTTNGIKLLWNNGNGTFTEGATRRGDDRVGLVHGRRRRGRERRRPPGRLRRRLRASVRSGAELARRLPHQPRRRPRSPLPERGERPERPRPLPRGRGPGGSRGVRLFARPGRDVPRRQRRRSAGSLCRERRGSEPALRQRPVAGRSEGRPRRPRLPLREPRRGLGCGGPVCRHGSRRRRRRKAARSTCSSAIRATSLPPRSRERPHPRSRTPAPTSTRRSEPAARAGATRSST